MTPARGHGQLAVFVAVACLSLCGCIDLPESSFELSPSSRLPGWFTLPAGLSRADVTVTMDYYGGRTVKFKMLDAKKHALAEPTGTAKGSEPLELKNPPAGFPPGYPVYEVITVNGMTEVAEHRRMEPIFYITDDAAVLAELGVSPRKQ